MPAQVISAGNMDQKTESDQSNDAQSVTKKPRPHPFRIFCTLSVILVLVISILLIVRLFQVHDKQMVFCNTHKGMTVDVKDGKAWFQGGEYSISSRPPDAEEGEHKIETVSDLAVTLANGISVENKTIRESLPLSFNGLFAFIRGRVMHYHYCSRTDSS